MCIFICSIFGSEILRSISIWDEDGPRTSTLRFIRRTPAAGTTVPWFDILAINDDSIGQNWFCPWQSICNFQERWLYEGSTERANSRTLKWHFCGRRFVIIILSKPDTKERLENHFKIFPHRPEETFGRMRFSKEIPCEQSKKKMMYGCLMCHRTFKSSRNCYSFKTPTYYGPYDIGLINHNKLW